MSELATLQPLKVRTTRLWDSDFNLLATLDDSPEPTVVDDVLLLTVVGPNPLGPAALEVVDQRNVYLTVDDGDGRTNCVVDRITVTDRAACRECGANKPAVTEFVGRLVSKTAGQGV